jgi:hypothetical protein
VRFGQKVNSFSISANDADTPLTGSNPELVEIHEEVIKRYLLKLDRDNILNRIRLALHPSTLLYLSIGVIHEEICTRC